MRTAAQEIERLNVDAAKIGERYNDYFVAVRTSNGLLLWRSSDKTWALGVCRRYAAAVDEMDRIYEHERYFDRLD